jgi:predicted  nucleic acid-binding Zn-ribbon protein
MQSEWLSRRVDLLEQQVEQLNTVSGEVTALRTEMRAEFADVRTEMRAEFADVRTEMRAEFADVRAEMRGGFEHTRTEFADVRAEMRGGFAAIHEVLISLQTQITDNHRHMLVLHEEVLSRITTLGERWERPPTRRRKKS